jgi:DNA-binding NarL/FixJ family response regulator
MTMNPLAETKKIKILIVDDHEIFRRGLRALLEPYSEWQICGEAVDGLDAVEKCQPLGADIVILDITMPRLNGLEAARLIKKQNPALRIVIITQHDSPQVQAAAMEAGAQAFVTKSSVGNELVSALRTIIKNMGEQRTQPSI